MYCKKLMLQLIALYLFGLHFRESINV